MITLLNEQEIIERILSHIDNKTTDLGEAVWREPVASYLSDERFESEIALLRRMPIPFCPSAILPENGSFITRKAAGTPLIVVRGDDGLVRAFINACRHRGMPVANDSGCARAFVCPYHAWTYGLDGQLKNIPGRSGFPGVELGGWSTSTRVARLIWQCLKMRLIFLHMNNKFSIKAIIPMRRTGS